MSQTNCPVVFKAFEPPAYRESVRPYYVLLKIAVILRLETKMIEFSCSLALKAGTTESSRAEVTAQCSLDTIHGPQLHSVSYVSALTAARTRVLSETFGI